MGKSIGRIEQIESGLGNQAFLEAVRDRYEQYLPREDSLPFDFNSLSDAGGLFVIKALGLANKNLKSVIEGEHGGLAYEDYKRFLGLLGKSVILAAADRAGSTELDVGLAWISNLSAGEGKRDRDVSVSLAEESRKLLAKLAREYWPKELRAVFAGEGGRFPHREDDVVQEKMLCVESIEQDVLSMAVVRGDLGVLNERLEIQENGLINQVDGSFTWKRDRPLFEAARYNRVGLAKTLLKAGANLDLTSRRVRGLSLISHAAFYGQTAFFKFMLTMGADPKVLADQKVGGRSVIEYLKHTENWSDGKSSEILRIIADFEESKLRGSTPGLDSLGGQKSLRDTGRDTG